MFTVRRRAVAALTVTGLLCATVTAVSAAAQTNAPDEAGQQKASASAAISPIGIPGGEPQSRSARSRPRTPPPTAP